MPNCHKNKRGSKKDKDDCDFGNKISKINKKLCEIKKCLACECSTPIFQKDLPLVITQPGCYCIAEDLIFNPTFSALAPPNAGAVQAAITIQASNVQLNFGCHTLSQAGEGTSTQVPFVIGVLIPNMAPNSTDTNPIVPGSLQSIYITGDRGVIQGFSMYGIRQFAHTYDVIYEGLTIKNCAGLASKGLRPPASATYGFEYLPHTLGQPVVITPGFGPSFGVAGLCIGEATTLGMGPVFFTDVANNVPNNVNRVGEVILENVSCLNNFSMNAITPLISNYTINNSHFDDAWSDDPGRSTAPAYSVIPAFGLNLFHGSANPFSDVNGLIDPNCVNVVVNNSTFNNSTLRGDSTTALVGASFPTSGVTDTRSRNLVWNNCQFSGASSTFLGGTNCGYVAGGVEDGP